MKSNLIEIVRKNKIYLRIGGINYFKVMVSKLHSTNLLDTLKFFLLALLFTPSLKVISKSGSSKSNILISKNFDSSKRKDYKEIYNNVKGFYLDCDELIISRRVNPFNIIVFFKEFKSTFIATKIDQLGVKDRFDVAFLLIYFQKLPSIINKSNISEFYNNYISFCDSYLEENFLAQYFNIKGLKTYTLQHGLYKNTGMECNNDSEAYANFVSDYMLVWGFYTKEELISAGICKDKLIVVGMPKFNINANSCTSNGYSETEACVYLNGDAGEIDNIEMLDVLVPFFRRKNIKFKIKKHPTSKFSDRDIKNIEEYMGLAASDEKRFKYNFVHSSGVAAELIVSGQIVMYFMNQKTPRFYKFSNTSFRDSKEVFKLMKDDDELKWRCLVQKNRISITTDKEEMSKLYNDAINR